MCSCLTLPRQNFSVLLYHIAPSYPKGNGPSGRLTWDFGAAGGMQTDMTPSPTVNSRLPVHVVQTPTCLRAK